MSAIASRPNHRLADSSSKPDASETTEHKATIAKEPAKQALHRLLSLSPQAFHPPHITTAQPPPEHIHQNRVHHIGEGSFGVIHSLTPPYASKRALTSYFSLANERDMHRTIQSAFSTYSNLLSAPVRIPQLAPYIEASDSAWWGTNGHLFPEDPLGRDFTVPSDLLMMERIPPLGRASREAVIDQYCIEQHRDACKLEQKNASCLLRPYLGRRRHSGGRISSMPINLRNYILNLDQLEEIGLDIGLLTKALAEALAILHWGAKTDAQDSEIVFGGPSTLAERSDTSANTELWLLDFNQCHTITMDEAGVDTAVKAYFMNDPYFPRPPFPGQLPRDGTMWEAFKSRYLETSKKIVDVGSEVWPALVIVKLEVGQFEKARAKMIALERAAADRYTDVERGEG